MSRRAVQLPKARTGIQGIDEITGGGLPAGRPTLVCGTAGCGKTLFGIEFLVRGATEFGEPGVMLAFEETAPDLSANVRSLGFDLDQLIAEKKLAVDHIHVDPSEIEETGEYNLDGLFIRLASAIDEVGAKRVVLDTIEALFSGFTNMAILRAELRRLFAWLKDRGVTAVITGERGDGQLTRQGLEEYVSDCVILLDHRVVDQVTTRRLRIVKYRGSAHGTNEYPFLIDERGISVLPITHLGLTHGASDERISTGVAGLDEMLGGQGVYRGSTVLISGTAGTGKSSMSAHFIDAACRRGERCLFLANEESAAQIVRNMRSIGVDLQPWIKKGRLVIHASRPTALGLEARLVEIHRRVEQLAPSLVVMDPITNLLQAGSQIESHAMLVRVIDWFKNAGITAVFTSLTAGGAALEGTDIGVSSLIDTWILVRQQESEGERNRTVYVLKSRGMAHSNQVREMLIGSRGIELVPAYVGPGGVMTGSARIAQERRDREGELDRQVETERRQAALASRRAALEAQRAALEAELSDVTLEAERASNAEVLRRERAASDQRTMEARRGVAATPVRNGRNGHRKGKSSHAE